MAATQNAFSERFSQYGFNFFDMLTSDVMHEVEIGVWKSVFIQLLRLLDAFPGNLANLLDARCVDRILVSSTWPVLIHVEGSDKSLPLERIPYADFGTTCPK